VSGICTQRTALPARLPDVRSLSLSLSAFCRALASGKSLLLEKTLFNLEGVLANAEAFRKRGCICHLLGTHIQPLRNWRFLETRMASGTSFGRYITKEQAMIGLQRYQENLEHILERPELRETFDSVHVYDVMADGWCVSKLSGSADTSSKVEVELGGPPPEGFEWGGAF